MNKTRWTGFAWRLAVCLTLSGVFPLSVSAFPQSESDAVPEEEIESEEIWHELIHVAGGDVVVGESGEITGVRFPSTDKLRRKTLASTEELEKLFRSLGHLGHLNSVSLLGRCASDRLVHTIADSLPDLRSLSLQNSVLLTNDGVQRISGLRSLESLYFNWYNIGKSSFPDGASKLNGDSLEFISAMDSLRHLYFFAVPDVDDDDLLHLSEMCQLRTLHVGLGSNSISDAGVRYLSGLVSLEELGIQGADIGDKTLDQLTEMKRLQDVMLSSVTEGQVFSAERTMQFVEQHPQLQAFNLEPTNVSCGQLRELLDSRKFERLFVTTTDDDAAAQRRIVEDHDETTKIRINGLWGKRFGIN